VPCGQRNSAPRVLWLILDVLGVGVVIVGGDAGAKMVFRMGYRVAGAEEK
jgi:hypothetical protein